jgi:hypothetical protein
MSKSQEDFDLVLDKLKSAKTEEEIIDHLVKMVKGFNISMYKDLFDSNPYYKSLLIDVKEVIIEDIEVLKTTIKDEIGIIDTELKNGNKEVDKLKELRIDCELLLSQLVSKEENIRRL